MSASSSNKKHSFDMPDNLKWSIQKNNQRLTRRALVRPPLSTQRQPMHQNGSKSTEPSEKQKSIQYSIQKSHRTPKPSKADSNFLEEKEPKPAGNQRTKGSTSKVPEKDEKLISENKISKPPGKVKDNYCKPKFSITLTREEIEQDYLVMTGKKLPRNMMKRDKTVQKNLDALFPAISLEGQNADNLAKKY